MADGPASPGGGSHESGEHSPRSNVREQDRYLPIANISRIMKKALPANGKIAKDAKETVQECVSEFISFITSELVCFFFLLILFSSVFLIYHRLLLIYNSLNSVGPLISVREKRERLLTAMICSGRWPLSVSRIIWILLKFTSLDTER